jgi:PAS domain S-box-containing protein
MSDKLNCWEVFKCEQKDCPAYKKEDVKCWLVSGTHCHEKMHGDFLEKMDMCLECKVFDANMDLPAVKDTIRLLSDQLKEQSNELEGISLDLAVGLSKSYTMLRKLSLGDPTARITLDTKNELLLRLETELNRLAESVELMINQFHELAIDITQHYDTLNKVAAGDFTARALESSGNELVSKLGVLINRQINTFVKLLEHHRRAWESLHESEKRYRNLIESIPEVIYTLSAEGGLFTSFNLAFEKITGWSRGEWLNKPFMPIVHPDDLQFNIDAYQRVLRGETSSPYETRVLTKSGDYIIVEIIAAPQIENGKIIGVFGIARDISKRKKAGESLQ